MFLCVGGDEAHYSRKDHHQRITGTWFLDFGCSNHITHDKRVFSQLDESSNSQVELGDSKQVKIIGKAVIAVHTQEGEEKHIHGVHYSSNITQNLLSVGQMIQKGYRLVFDDDHYQVINKRMKKTVAVVKMSLNNLFSLNLETLHKFALKNEVVDESWLWHLRYGHLNYKGLQLL